MNKLTLTIASFAVAASSVSSQGVPNPRSFSTIDIRGNDRFSDRDILATADLSAGQTLSQIDIERAVEALDYTGEFKSIAINSTGQTLIITVVEQPEFSGDLTFGVGFDSDSGIIGVANLALEDIIATGVDLTATARIAQEFRTASAQITSDALLGGGKVVGLRLSYGSFDYDNTLFDYDRISFTPFVIFALSEETDLELRYTYSQDDIRNVAPSASAILQAEAGKVATSAIGATLRHDGKDMGAGIDWGFQISQDIAFGEDLSYSRSAGQLNASVPLASTGFALRTAIEFGRVIGSDDTNPRATDRFTLGGAALRGFARGGISPRDTTATTSTTLGGNTYVAARTDLLLPVLQDREGLDVFVFADVGSAWGVETDVAPDGILDTDRIMRTSRGVGASYQTGLGHFEAYYAFTTDSEDNDLTRAFGLTFRSDF